MERRSHNNLTHLQFDNHKDSNITTPPILLNYKNHPAYILFISSLKANYTKLKYDGCLQKYLKHPSNINLDSLDIILKKDSKVIESEITQQLIEMRNSGMAYSTAVVHLAALYHFFSINDITINRKKLSKFVGEQENKYEYRSYTHDEISSLLSLCDERGKVIVLLMASTGMRVGALPGLKLKHLKKHRLDTYNSSVKGQEEYTYQINVYASSKKYRYTAFCTPECAKAIDTYLEYRKRFEKTLDINPSTGEWGPPDSLLITRVFDINDIPFSSNNHRLFVQKPMGVMGLRSYVVGRLKKMNLRKTWISTENSEYMSAHKNELHPCHSFRIFAVTNMQRSKIDKTIREMLVGHSTGLDTAYYKPNTEEILQEYLKAVDLLTINNEHRLQKQINQYKESSEGMDEIHQKLNEKHEQDIKNIKEEMNGQFLQIMKLIQQNHLLINVKPEVLEKIVK